MTDNPLHAVINSRASAGWFTSLKDETPPPQPTPRDYMADALRELDDFLNRPRHTP